MAVNPNRTLIDVTQILQRAFDEPNDRVRVDAAVSIEGGSFTIEHTTDSIRLGDGTAFLTSSIVDAKRGLDVNIIGGVVSGTFTPQGLGLALKAQRKVITSVPTKIPTTALADRNSMSIRVLGTNTVYFGDSTVTWENGYPKFQFEELIADIKDNATVEVYGVCEPGKTSEVAVLELA